VRVGIIILADERWSVAARRWRLAEQYGFDHAWTYDHIGWRSLVDGPWFDAVPTLTAAAHVTSRIRLGTMVASPNFRHPVHFAREVTALDDISDGRLLLGVGAGGVDYDAHVIGTPALSRRERVDRYGEFLSILDRLLRDETVTTAGTYYTAVDARGTPGCVQQPRVPFVVAANGPRSLALAARYGQGWVTTGGSPASLPASSRASSPASSLDASLDAWWRVVGESARRLDEALIAAGREPSTVDRYVSLDACGTFSLSSVDFFTDCAGRAAELGFTDILTHWPRREDWYAGDEAVLEAVAADVLPTLTRG
jgi:alkanesulfonate monooxygenase SsuD/methylene tetrahydromethanopterin reductase-like flavin-dependent oxidoreductase (luciferase family)